MFRALTASIVCLVVGCGAAAPSEATTTTSATPNPAFVEDLRGEANELLTEIAQREAVFLSEYGAYAASSTEMASATALVMDPPWSPSSIPRDGARVTWEPALPGWGELGFAPDETVALQLRIAVGPPGSTPPGGGPTDDAWFVASARAVVGGNIHTWIRRSWDPAIVELEPMMEP